MLIKKIEIIYIKLPMKIVFITSFGEINYRPAIIIKMTDTKGNEGFGESSLLDVPISEPETSNIALNILEKKIIPTILGKKIKSVLHLHLILESYFKKYPITMTGVENAYLHLVSIRKNKTLANLLGGARRKIAIGHSIGIQENTEKILQAVEYALTAGFKKIKIKIKPGYDIEIIKNVRKKFPHISLAVDANAAYAKKDLALFKKMDKLHLYMIEQPFKARDFRLHAQLQKAIKTPICLDESVINIETAKKAIKMGSCKIINVKPARVGGCINTIKIHDLCKKNKIPCWIGGRLETGVGQIFNLSVASLPNFLLPSEIIPSNAFLKTDIIKNKIVFNKGMTPVPKLIGGKIVLDESVLKKYVIWRKTFIA